MKRAKLFILLIFTSILIGCAFTQEDYDLQEKRYERDRKMQEQQSQGTAGWKW
jgi:hypothetical protein